MKINYFAAYFPLTDLLRQDLELLYGIHVKINIYYHSDFVWNQQKLRKLKAYY